MRFVRAVSIVAAVCAALLVAVAVPAAGPGTVPPRSSAVSDLQSSQSSFPPIFRDADRDGWSADLDCNDDDAAVNPASAELDNGLDDDCNGVIDDGFDTLVDSPSLSRMTAVWPDTLSRDTDEWIPLEATPRIVAAGAHFLAAWSDYGNRVRLARVGVDGVLLDNPPLKLRSDARAPDIAWTGTRLGVVYEDRSGNKPDVRLMILDATGTPLHDVLVAANATAPKIAWGVDRFGVVWHAESCVWNCLQFQRFDRDGSILGVVDMLERSGFAPSIAFSGSAVEVDSSGSRGRPGSFGVVYEVFEDFAASTEVQLAVLPLDPYGRRMSVVVNEHKEAHSSLGAQPSIAANVTGFGVCWHVVVDGVDGACMRFIPIDTVAPVQEFAPDADAGRASHMLWTGGEFVVANDNIVKEPTGGYDVHLRRADPSGNTHLSAGWGPWRELNLGAATPGPISVHPDLALTTAGCGVLWIEQEGDKPDLGRIWFAGIAHR